MLFYFIFNKKWKENNKEGQLKVSRKSTISHKGALIFCGRKRPKMASKILTMIIQSNTNLRSNFTNVNKIPGELMLRLLALWAQPSLVSSWPAQILISWLQRLEWLAEWG